ncbi:MAG TPA: hypothetical protein VJ890_21640 [Vineibacter sp.]|nr:hypothetical protein [Vineibacter sp.]
MGSSTGKKPAKRLSLALPDRRFRTHAGNAAHAIDGVDGRSQVGRRFGQVAAQVAADIGGPEVMSEAQIQLARTTAGLVVLREQLDRRLARRRRVDVADYTRLSNSLTRVLSAIGIKRLPRDVTPPTIEQYAAQVRRQRDAA